MKTSSHIVMLLALVLTQNTGAIQVAGEPPSASFSQAVSGEREGSIGEIDLDGKNMIVDGISYSFSMATTAVHGTSLLAIRKNDRIRFKAINESGKERIIEIWLMPAAQH